MTIYIDFTRSPTGSRLYNSGIFRRWNERSSAGAGDVILKWGRGMGGYPRDAKLINPVICSDKLYQGMRLLGAGLPLPPLYRNQAEWGQAGFPDLVKKPREGEGGRGVELCKRNNNPPDWRLYNIYMKFINKIREFRVLQLGRHTAYIMEKFPPNATITPVAWNLHQGATWHRIWSGDSMTALHKELSELAKKSIMALDYDLAGVDLMMDQDRKLWVLECNSRPGLGPENLKLFVETMKKFAKDYE